MPSISTKQTITSHLKSLNPKKITSQLKSLNTKKNNLSTQDIEQKKKTSHLKSLNTKKTMTYDVGNPGRCLVCGILTLSLLIIIFQMAIQI